MRQRGVGKILDADQGPTERNSIDEILAPPLASFSIDTRTRVVVTNRKLGKRSGPGRRLS